MMLILKVTLRKKKNSDASTWNGLYEDVTDLLHRASKKTFCNFVHAFQENFSGSGSKAVDEVVDFTTKRLQDNKATCGGIAAGDDEQDSGNSEGQSGSNTRDTSEKDGAASDPKEDAFDPSSLPRANFTSAGILENPFYLGGRLIKRGTGPAPKVEEWLKELDFVDGAPAFFLPAVKNNAILFVAWRVAELWRAEDEEGSLPLVGSELALMEALKVEKTSKEIGDIGKWVWKNDEPDKFMADDNDFAKTLKEKFLTAAETMHKSATAAIDGREALGPLLRDVINQLKKDFFGE
mmetsp:Transcript_24242/g.61010  ORF Transcript_24242/g.61010 Transcript_24242/m.61010 type:complete len:293 (+) Transcript_24242:2340-3218(+)